MQHLGAVFLRRGTRDGTGELKVDVVDVTSLQEEDDFHLQPRVMGVHVHLQEANVCLGMCFTAVSE